MRDIAQLAATGIAPSTVDGQPASDTESRYRLLADNATDVVLQTGAQGTIEWASPSITEILGWQPHEVVGGTVSSLMHPDDLAEVRKLQKAVLSSGGSEGRTEARFATKSGGWRWMSDHGRALFDSQHRLIGGIDALRDIQAEHDARDSLAESEELFRTAMDCAPIGMAVLDLQRGFQQVNNALCEMIRRDANWLLQRNVADIVLADDDAFDQALRDELLLGGRRSHTREMRLIRSDGATVWTQHSIGIIHDSTGRPKAFVSQFVDMTEAHLAQERLAFVADHDALTGVCNRRAIMNAMTSVLSHAPRRDSNLAIVYCDIDDLKPVNDSFGHAAGDAMIMETATRISSVVRDQDTVGRLGGDEFVTLLPGVGSLADATRVAEKMLAALHAPFAVDGVDMPIRASLGVTIAVPGEAPDAVLHRADQALYAAKARGGDCLMATDPELDAARRWGHN